MRSIFVDGDRVRRPVVELRRLRRRVPRDLLPRVRASPVLAGYRRTASDRGRGQARPFGAADLAAVLATCHPPRPRGRGVESDQVAREGLVAAAHAGDDQRFRAGLASRRDQGVDLPLQTG